MLQPIVKQRVDRFVYIENALRDSSYAIVDIAADRRDSWIVANFFIDRFVVSPTVQHEMVLQGKIYENDDPEPLTGHLAKGLQPSVQQISGQFVLPGGKKGEVVFSISAGTESVRLEYNDLPRYSRFSVARVGILDQPLGPNFPPLTVRWR